MGIQPTQCRAHVMLSCDWCTGGEEIGGKGTEREAVNIVASQGKERCWWGFWGQGCNQV